MKTLKKLGLAVLLLGTFNLLAPALKASASPVVNEYALPAGYYPPHSFSLGQDGSLWMLDRTPNGIGEPGVTKVQDDGSYVRYPLSSPVGSSWEDCSDLGDTLGITSGPDGNMWFSVVCEVTTSGGSHSYFNYIYKITMDGTSTHYAIDESFPHYAIGPNFISSGPDGNIWVVYGDDDSDKTAVFVKLNTSGQTLAHYDISYPSWPTNLTPDNNNNIWFSDVKNNPIGKINTQGEITHYNIPNNGKASNSVIGPDGKPIFYGTEDNSNAPEGRSMALFNLNNEGQVISTPIVGFELSSDAQLYLGTHGLAIDNNESLWLSAFGNSLVRVSPSGEQTKYQILSSDKRIYQLVSKPDGSIWGLAFNTETQTPFVVRFKLNETPSNGGNNTPNPPRTGKLIGATLITVSIFGGLIVLAREYQNKHHKSSVK